MAVRVLVGRGAISKQAWVWVMTTLLGDTVRSVLLGTWYGACAKYQGLQRMSVLKSLTLWMAVLTPCWVSWASDRPSRVLVAISAATKPIWLKLPSEMLGAYCWPIFL